jgi:hypothetical protein
VIEKKRKKKKEKVERKKRRSIFIKIKSRKTDFWLLAFAAAK